ncbi:MAG: hypothetical protein U0414_39340 [Polyangiaceae bacterium]
MNNQRVQTLEALLTRIKKNAGEPRPERARPRADAPVGAETRGAATAKPAAEIRTVPPQAAKVSEPPKAAAPPVAKTPEPKKPVAADVVPSHTGAPKVTPRLIDPVTSADQDPAKWTLDDMGTGEPSPKPAQVTPKPAVTKPVEAKPIEAKPPVEVKRQSIPEAKPSPRAEGGRVGLGLGGFGRQIEAKKQEPKAEPAKPVEAPKVEAPKVEAPKPVAPPPDVELDIDEPTHMEEKGGARVLPNFSDTPDEEVEATVSGPIPTHILEMSRAASQAKDPPKAKLEQPKAIEPSAVDAALDIPSPPAIELQSSSGPAGVEPPREEPKKGIGHTIPMAMDAPDVDVAISENVTLPLERKPQLIEIAKPAEKPAEPAPRPEPEPIAADPIDKPSAKPAEKPVEKAAEPPAEKPASKPADSAFSAGSTNDAPSKFAQELTPQPRSSGFFVKTLIVAVVLVAAAAGVFVYMRKDEFFGGGAKTADSTQPPPTAESTPKPTPSPTLSASTAPLTVPPGSADPASSGAPAPSSSAAPSTVGDVGEPPKNPKQLGPTQGYIFVQTTLEGDVYTGGVKVGPVNQWVITPCKAAYLTVGKVMGQWAAPPKTVTVPCQDKLVVSIP